MERWPHQPFALEAIQAAIAQGQRRIVLTSPTGGGKSVIVTDLIDQLVEAKKKVAVYTNRKLLVEQLSRVLEQQGINHGVRAAGYEAEHWPVQICSMQTEHSRVVKRKKMPLFPAEIVFVDEAHLQTGPAARKIIAEHWQAGAAIVGITATPLDLEGVYEHLIVAGTTSSLRACKALVPAIHYGPDEPDLKHFKGLVEGKDLTEKQVVKAMMTKGLFGRVLEWFNKLNPDRKPSILFAPGVRESIWFAEEFRKVGISAAHIDGENVWVDGKFEASSPTLRQQILEDSRNGKICILCNRFVLREGIDAPWLAHGVFATVFGSLQSYLQSGGRLLRACGGMESITIQDHGGNWWRHGSLNEDREWRLDLTAEIAYGLRAEAIRQKKKTSPINCPRCHRILNRRTCPCGYEIPLGKTSRPVAQTDGAIKQMWGDIFPERVTKDRRPDAMKLWEKMYFRCLNRDATFRQGMALYAYENDWNWPARDWPLMPFADRDLFRKVSEVPRERLR